MKKILLLLSLLVFMCGCAVDASERTAASIAETKTVTITAVPVKEQQVEVYNKSDINTGVTAENFSLYNKHNPNQPSVCCYVEATDTIFFSVNNILYQQNGEEIIPLLGIRAANINLVDGWLYFNSPEKYMDDFNPVGPVYKYCPETGELVKIFDGDVRYMSYNGENLVIRTVEDIHEKAITYINPDGTEVETVGQFYEDTCFECDLSGNIIREIPCDRLLSVDNGRMVVAETENGKPVYNLYTSDGKKQLPIDGSEIFPDIVCFVGENIYAYHNEDLWRYNITTGQEDIIESVGYMYDYTYSDGAFYIYNGNVLCEVSENFGIGYRKTITAPKHEIYFSLYPCGDDFYMQNGLKLMLAEKTGSSYTVKGVETE